MLCHLGLWNGYFLLISREYISSIFQVTAAVQIQLKVRL